MSGITLIPISMNLGQPCKVDTQAPCHPPGNQAQEVQLPTASKPKRTGSLALFYRKVSVLTHKWCPWPCWSKPPCASPVTFSLHVLFPWQMQFLYTLKKKGRDVECCRKSSFPLSTHVISFFFLIRSFYK